MIAFVLSSGGNRGALQAGALLALLEAGIVPDMLVGTSVGALNATLLALDPTLNGAQHLADIWRHARTSDFFPGNFFDIIRRVLTGQSLYPNDALRQFTERNLPKGHHTFGSLPIPLYMVSTNLNTGCANIWGDDPHASILPAALASAAYPVAFPPVHIGGYQLIDGAVVANVPIGAAVDHGATEIYVVNVAYGGEPVARQPNTIAILNRAIVVAVYTQLVLEWIGARERGVKLHYLGLTGFDDVWMFSLDQSAAMVDSGHQQAKEFLQKESEPGRVPPTDIPPAFTPCGGINNQIGREVPKGARVYVPPWQR